MQNSSLIAGFFFCEVGSHNETDCNGPGERRVWGWAELRSTWNGRCSRQCFICTADYACLDNNAACNLLDILTPTIAPGGYTVSAYSRNANEWFKHGVTTWRRSCRDELPTAFFTPPILLLLRWISIETSDLATLSDRLLLLLCIFYEIHLYE